MKVLTIGRATGNDIVITDSKASRNHLQIVQSDNGQISVIDLGSTNGTYVNGQRIHGERPISPGDTLRIGDTTLPWQSYFSPQATPMPPTQHPTPQPWPQGGKSKKNLWLYIIIGALTLLLVGGVITWTVISGKNKEQDADKDLTNQILKEEVDLLRKDAEKAQNDYETALAEAKRTGSAQAKRTADSLKAVAKLKNTGYQKKQTELEGKTKELQTENEKLKKQIEELQKQKQTTPTNTTTASNKTSASNEPQETEDLKKRFYDEVDKIKNDYNKLSVACNKLNVKMAHGATTNKKLENTAQKLKDEFDNLKNDTERQNWITKISTAQSAKKIDEQTLSTSTDPNTSSEKQNTNSANTSKN